jgi:hypothetical protein
VTNLAGIAHVAQNAYRTLKQDAVDQAGGPTDLFPILTVAAVGTDPFVVVCPHGLLPGAVRHLAAGLEPEVLTYCADVRIQTIPLPPGLRLRPPNNGGSAAAVQAGDMTVREALSTTVVTKDASHTVVAAYRYDDRGRLVFDSATDEDAFGGVIDELRQAWT